MREITLVAPCILLNFLFFIFFLKKKKRKKKREKATHIPYFSIFSCSVANFTAEAFWFTSHYLRKSVGTINRNSMLYNIAIVDHNRGQHQLHQLQPAGTALY
jgi:hypothetical protein